MFLLGALLALGPALTACSAKPPAPAAAPATPDVTAPALPAAVLPLPRSSPERVLIGRLGLDAPLVPVGRADDGTVATPPLSQPTLAGWFTGSVTPGEQGTAVIVGHVDTRTGPAVFYPLSVTRVGDSVVVRRADHSSAAFTVYRIEVISRDAFDDAKVYGATGRPELRLITCGGTFDPDAQEYSSNVVVYARLTGSTTPPPVADDPHTPGRSPSARGERG